jgi:NDP-sugar pyrophosphorylase family protein
MIETGTRFSTIEVDNWFNCGKKDVLLETNAIMLRRKGYASANLPEFDNSIIIHPVSIGENCQIVNSIIGPHVTIGNNVRINNAIVRDSIIGNYAAIQVAQALTGSGFKLVPEVIVGGGTNSQGGGGTLVDVLLANLIRDQAAKAQSASNTPNPVLEA